MIQGTDMQTLPLEELVFQLSKKKELASLYNHASEAWNHNFFWKCMCPRATAPSASTLGRLELHFGGLDRFKAKFEQIANVHTGSGWTWLVDHDGHLEVTNTSNCMSPIIDPKITPLLVLDLWEHAYFLDYPYNRKEYMENWWPVVNWAFVEEQACEADQKNSWMQVGQSLKEYPNPA
jgi:Fe-Mn family superoxide dismutase